MVCEALSRVNLKFKEVMGDFTSLEKRHRSISRLSVESDGSLSVAYADVPRPLSTVKKIVGSHGRTFKVVILGDVGVGKTSIMRQFVQRQFYGEHLASAGVCVYEVGHFIECRKEWRQIDMDVRDFGGDLKTVFPERYESELRDADAFLLVYVDNQTLCHVMQTVVDIAAVREVPPPTLVVRNMCDLKINTKRSSAYFSVGNALLTHVSAKYNVHVDDTIKTMAEMLHNFYLAT